ncbi:formate dehydrogenase subunit delta [Herminiimonas sp. NPDC097707]|uniref:formate dehydrogenase subunit delta n=1 Tax=Herminiimonas sp. NPDC097707 TaxID=3364007 RepID=UPI00383ADEA0
MSHSTVDNLITMANQIGDFFETMTDRTQSLKDISGHLKRSWAPPMRRKLMEHVEHGGDGLKDIVLEALRTNKVI